MDDQCLNYAVEGGVVQITMNDPATLNYAMSPDPPDPSSPDPSREPRVQLPAKKRAAIGRAT